VHCHRWAQLVGDFIYLILAVVLLVRLPPKNS
jgi:hypothetical protein